MTVYPPEIYDGAQFTVRYDQCQQRITDYYHYDDDNGNTITLPFGFGCALKMAVDENFINPGNYPVFFTDYVDTVIDNLELRDFCKELSAETPDAWMQFCMRRWCEVIRKWEPILTMQGTTGFDVSNPNKESRIIEYGHTIDGSVQDTPYGQLDDTSDYVSGRTHETHSGEDKIHERNELDAEILMDLRRKWEDSINLLVEEFDVLFIRITGGDFIA